MPVSGGGGAMSDVSWPRAAYRGWGRRRGKGEH